MPTSIRLLALCALVVILATDSESRAAASDAEDGKLTIAAFNIQNLGSSKVTKQDVMKIIAKIITHYDIIFIQEIVDNKGIVMTGLMNQLKSEPKGSTYDYVISERLGRSNAKEQYAYVYRTDRVKLLDSYTYKEVEDEFEREPFIAIFKPAFASKVAKFALIGIHVKPGVFVSSVTLEKKKHAVEEIKRLHEVVEQVRADKKKGASDILLMGDFNAGCGFFPKKDWPSVPLWTENVVYHWLIGHDADTTVAKQSSCPYDRIIVTGEKLKQAVVQDSAGPFQYDAKYKLTSNMTKAVSDHYPVQVTLDVTRPLRKP